MIERGPPICATHVIASIAPELGGPSYSVPALASAIGRHGVDLTLRTLMAGASIPVQSADYALKLHGRSSGPIGRILSGSPDLLTALERDARTGNILHTHGLWLLPNVYPAWAIRRAGGVAKLVHSPRGMLGREALKISARKKQVFWRLLQRSALHSADCLHATAASEYEEIRAAGLTKPVAIIPNGIDLPDLSLTIREPRRERTLLSLGRLHPKKGLDSLVRAWALVEADFPDWRLRIVGPAELRHDEMLRGLAASLGTKHVTIEVPIFGSEKLQAYRAADLFVLPTLNENFAMTVAEALAAEVPVISTKGAPWAGLETERCGWWIDHGVEPLAKTLRRTMSLPDHERAAMGARGRAWMARDFSWDRIGADMVDVYDWLSTGIQPPSTIRLD